jgi:hypothetical protein
VVFGPSATSETVDLPDLRTTITELVTGLGMCGHSTLESALDAAPREMVSVSPETWLQLRGAHEGGAHASAFDEAWDNGIAFLCAREGLRGRRPVLIEWKGGHRPIGDDVIPVDLRIDHVFLISCKYRSDILHNSSPAALFEELLAPGSLARGADWFDAVAPAAYQHLYESVRTTLGSDDLPQSAHDLAPGDREHLAARLRGAWPADLDAVVGDFCAQVAAATATRWRASLSTPRRQETMLWRLLRIASSPYFLLGGTLERPLRLRIATPWDWRQRFTLKRFEVEPQPGGQPRVGWRALVTDRHAGNEQVVEGHVEVRWSHGRFAQPPEAKVYLDTPHHEVPGYFPLV